MMSVDGLRGLPGTTTVVQDTKHTCKDQPN